MAEPTIQDMLSWPPPNYVNPHTRKNLLFGVDIPCIVIMSVFVAGRFFSKVSKKIVLGMDDWVMLVAWVIAVAMTVIDLVSINYGTGVHLWDMKAIWIPMAGKLAIATQALFAPCAGLTKISICMTYLRLFPSQANRRFCYCVIVCLILWTIAITFVMIFQCMPIESYWDTSITKTCVNQRVALIASAALNSLSDLLVYLWPAQYLWSVQLPRNKRLGLLFSFCFGCIACIAGACRIWYLQVFFDSYDIGYEGAVLYVINTIEISFGVVCGSLPGAKPVICCCFPARFGTTRDNSYGSSRKRPTGSNSFPFLEITNDDVKPIGAITVQRDIELYHVPVDKTVSGTSAVSATSGDKGVRAGSGDGGSEDWIFNPHAR